MRSFVVALSLLAVLALPAAVLAHEGHAHKVMGAVTVSDAKHLEVKTAEGKTVSVLVNKETKYLKGTAAAAAADVEVGARVVVEVAGEADRLTARVVRLGEAPAQGQSTKP